MPGFPFAFETRAIRELYRRLAVHDQRLTKLEDRMSALSDVISAMDADTTRIAAKIDAIQARLDAGDASAAAELGPLSDRLKALGSDPANPVPPATP